MKIPSEYEKEEMLKAIGLESIEELFADVPESMRSKLSIDSPKSEMDVIKELSSLAEKNRKNLSFLGGGIAKHHMPSALSYLLSRSEFLTAYTPYQPEISQGSLQAMFEYQSYVSELYNMDVVNASMYDMATALGEACLMCFRVKGGKKFLIPTAIGEAKKAVLRNYAKGFNISIEQYGYDKRGMVDIEDLKRKVDGETAGVYVETPNMFGVLEEDIDAVRDVAPMLVVGANPLALPVIKAPGDYNADIAIGGLAFDISFGGPLLGIFSCKKEYMRQMPGRIIGLTKDKEGRDGFCMVLQTREQHIRRARATSNICTNEGLLAMAGAIYFSLMGRSGMRDMAIKNIRNAMNLSKRVKELFEVPFYGSTFFSEFVFEYERMENLRGEALERGVEFGPLLTDKRALICTTELHGKEDHDLLIDVLREAKNV
jgi:glycine dehydrogenase subunit 1